MAKWRCTVCNYIYDEEKKGVRFNDLPSDWFCPICAAPKSAFVLMGSGRVEEEDAYAPTVADKIVKQLTEFGVEYVFGIPGDSILPLVDSLSRQDDIKFMLTRHEETAAFMASAYAKLTGKLGVCLSIAGPGATNLITGLVDAATDRAPVLALLGQVAQVHLGSESLQEIDEIEIFAPFTVFHEAISKPAQAINLTVLAVKNAYLRQGVSVLSLPTDVLSETLRDTIWKPEEHLFQQKTAPSKNDVEKAIKLIHESRKPLVFGGWGIRDCGAEVLQLAEKISAPIATTTRAKGVIPESHPMVVGVLGSVGTRFAVKAITNADLVIVIGSGFRQRNLLPKLPIIQIDVDGVKLGKSFPISCGLIGDAKTTVQMILDGVSQKEADEDYFMEISKLKEENRREIMKDSLDRSVPIHPGFVIQTLKKHAKKDAIITVDSGDHTYWFYKKYICDEERTLLSSNMASMAFALPAALAAQIAYPDKQVIAVNGDGGFSMLMADFTTAVQNNLPVKVIVFNDSMLKNIAKEQLLYGYPEFGTHFVNPDFAAFASSCGGEGYRVETPEELETALKQAFASDKPALIDIIVDPEKMAPIIKTSEDN
jgi:pyruvate oxidase